MTLGPDRVHQGFDFSDCHENFFALCCVKMNSGAKTEFVAILAFPYSVQ